MAAITIRAHISRRPPIQFQMVFIRRRPPRLMRKSAVTHLADGVGRRVRIGLTAIDSVKVGSGGGTKGVGSCDGRPRCQAHAMLTGTPKATADARVATRAQPTPDPAHDGDAEITQDLFLTKWSSIPGEFEAPLAPTVDFGGDHLLRFKTYLGSKRSAHQS